MQKLQEKEISFYQRNKQLLENIFDISLPELDSSEPDFNERITYYRSIFDIFESERAFHIAYPHFELYNDEAIYLEGKIVFFNDVNYQPSQEEELE